MFDYLHLALLAEVGSVLLPYLLEKLAPLQVEQVVAQVQVKLEQQLVVHDLKQ